MLFLHLQGREDGDGSAWTRSFGPPHLYRAWEAPSEAPRDPSHGYPAASARSVSGAGLKTLYFPSAPVPSCCCQLICQQSMMLYTLIEVYLSDLAARVSYLELITMSGFSDVYSSTARYPCTLWTKCLSVVVSAYIRNEFNGLRDVSLQKFASIQVNHT